MVGVRLKIARAEQHIADLEARVKVFFEGAPYEVVTSEDGDDRVFRIHVRAEPTLEWSAILGDAIQNLRAALDHLAWQLVLANGGTPDTSTAFPIAKTEEDFEKSLPQRLSGASSEALHAVRTLKPYPGGNDALCRLHDFSNIDKHRLLLTVGSAYKNIIVDMAKDLKLPGEGSLSMPIALTPADREYPLKDGAELFRVKPAARNSESAKSPHFTVEIAFGDGGAPLLPTLRDLAAAVKRAAETLGPMLLKR